MRLEDLIKLYKTEEYEFYKYTDKDGEKINTNFIFETHKDYLDKYLSFYKTIPDLTQVVVYAVDGIFKLTNQGIEFFIRHNHQEVFEDRNGNIRGVSYELTKIVRNNLLKRINDIMAVTDFNQLHKIVTECKVKGFGPLAIYDTTQRIASKMNIEPDKIYIMAGAKKGIELLEEKGYIAKGLSKNKTIEMKDLPIELQVLSPSEAHHFSCSKKKEIESLEINQI